MNFNLFDFLVLSTTICGSYDSWKNNKEITSLVDMNTNSTCIFLKSVYPELENKIIQSISLGLLFSMYIYASAQLTRVESTFVESTFAQLNSSNID